MKETLKELKEIKKELQDIRSILEPKKLEHKLAISEDVKETLLKDRGHILITGGKHLSEQQKEKIIKDIDDLLENHPVVRYGLRLIILE